MRRERPEECRVRLKREGSHRPHGGWCRLVRCEVPDSPAPFHLLRPPVRSRFRSAIVPLISVSCPCAEGAHSAGRRTQVWHVQHCSRTPDNGSLRGTERCGWRSSGILLRNRLSPEGSSSRGEMTRWKPRRLLPVLPEVRKSRLAGETGRRSTFPVRREDGHRARNE